MSGKDTRKKAKKESRKKDTPSSRKRKSFTMMSSSTPRAFDDDDEEGPSNEGNEEIQALSRQLNKKGLQHIVTALAKQGLGLADLLLCEAKEMRQSVKEVLLDAQSDIDEQQITVELPCYRSIALSDISERRLNCFCAFDAPRRALSA